MGNFLIIRRKWEIPEEKNELLQTIINICKEHDIYSICKGWGSKASYTRLSFIINNHEKCLCIDNLIQINMNGDNIGNISIAVDPVIYKEVHTTLIEILQTHNYTANNNNLSTTKKKIFTDLLTDLNNLRNGIFISNKLIYTKLFSTEYIENTSHNKQILIPINDF